MELPYKAVNNTEIINLRQGLDLIRKQIKAQRIDPELLNIQVDKLDAFLTRTDQEQARLTHHARFEALYNISRVIGSSLDLQTVLDQVMDAIIKLTGAERGFLVLRDDDGEAKVKAARNFDQQTLGDDDFKFSRTIVNQVLDHHQPILTTNAAEDPRFEGNISVVAQALRSIMATPLRARGNVIGLIYVDNRMMTGLFSNEDLAALDALSTQAAIAIDNALLFSATDEALTRRVEELSQLRRIDMQLNETLDAEKAIYFTLEWACRLSEAQSGHLCLFDDDEGDTTTSAVVHHYGLSEAEATAFPPLAHVYPAIDEVIALEKTLMMIAPDAAALIVPIKRDQNIIGVMILDKATPFSEDQQDLVERVVTRAAFAIENARLYAAVRMADKAKSEFVGVVAHDLKAPMTAIKGYAEMVVMVNNNLDHNQAEFMERIRQTVKRMEMLVSDLADISRIESGHFFMDEIEVPTQEVVAAVKASTLPQIIEYQHTLIEDVEDDLPNLWVDYYRLLQVLTNLVSNAYKYTPPGGTITLSIYRYDDERVAFSVADNGIGLSPEALEKLGTKFWRSEDHFTRSQPGTGLGFAITRHLIEQMGSTIEIESAVGEGSKFTFTIQAIKDV